MYRLLSRSQRFEQALDQKLAVIEREIEALQSQIRDKTDRQIRIVEGVGGRWDGHIVKPEVVAHRQDWNVQWKADLRKARVEQARRQLQELGGNLALFNLAQMLWRKCDACEACEVKLPAGISKKDALLLEDRLNDSTDGDSTFFHYHADDHSIEVIPD